MDEDKFRKETRYESENLVSYTCMDANGQVVEQGIAKTINISGGGVLMEMHEPLDVDCDILVLTIGLDDDVMLVEGKIVFSSFADEGKMEYGVKFCKTDMKSKENFEKYVKMFSEEQDFMKNLGIEIV